MKFQEGDRFTVAKSDGGSGEPCTIVVDVETLCEKRLDPKSRKWKTKLTTIRKEKLIETPCGGRIHMEYLRWIMLRWADWNQYDPSPAQIKQFQDAYGPWGGVNSVYPNWIHIVEQIIAEGMLE